MTGLIVASPLPSIGSNFANPTRAYEAAEDSELLALFEHVARRDELLIAGDLADPASDYRRRLRGTLLTAYGGHVFYVANLAYEHYDRADAAQRLENLRTFFGASCSNWHGAWLKNADVTGVLVSDRCLPRWWNQPGIGLEVVERNGRWTLLQPHGPPPGRRVERPSWEPVKPRYGRATCL